MNFRTTRPFRLRDGAEPRDAPEDYAPKCPFLERGYCEKLWDSDYGARRCTYRYEDWEEECPVYLEDAEE